MDTEKYRNELLSKLDKEVIDYLHSVGRIYNFKREEVIFLESDSANHCYFILKGRVKISRLNKEGKEVMLAILCEGNFFGEMGLLDGLTRSADAMAEDHCEILEIREDKFFELIEKFPRVANEVLKELAHRLRNSDSQIKGLSLLNARGKVASALLRWAIDQGVIEGDTIKIIGGPTQSEMASYVGLTRETFNRIQRQLLHEGYINTQSGGTIVINNFSEFKKIFGPFY